MVSCGFSSAFGCSTTFLFHHFFLFLPQPVVQLFLQQPVAAQLLLQEELLLPFPLSLLSLPSSLLSSTFSTFSSFFSTFSTFSSFFFFHNRRWLLLLNYLFFRSCGIVFLLLLSFQASLRQIDLVAFNLATLSLWNSCCKARYISSVSFDVGLRSSLLNPFLPKSLPAFLYRC